MKDEDASHCKLCEKEFSISRRKVGVPLQPSRTVSRFVLRFQRRSSLSSTTVATAGRFSATAAQTTSCPCPPRPNRSGSATPATPSCCSGAPPTPREPHHQHHHLLLLLLINGTDQPHHTGGKRWPFCDLLLSSTPLFVSSLHQRP